MHLSASCLSDYTYFFCKESSEYSFSYGIFFKIPKCQQHSQHPLNAPTFAIPTLLPSLKNDKAAASCLDSDQDFNKSTSNPQSNFSNTGGKTDQFALPVCDSFTVFTRTTRLLFHIEHITGLPVKYSYRTLYGRIALR